MWGPAKHGPSMGKARRSFLPGSGLTSSDVCLYEEVDSLYRATRQLMQSSVVFIRRVVWIPMEVVALWVVHTNHLYIVLRERS